VGSDANLKAKVQSRKSELKKQVEDEVRDSDIRRLDQLMKELQLETPCTDPIEKLINF